MSKVVSEQLILLRGVWTVLQTRSPWDWDLKEVQESEQRSAGRDVCERSRVIHSWAEKSLACAGPSFKFHLPRAPSTGEWRWAEGGYEASYYSHCQKCLSSWNIGDLGTGNPFWTQRKGQLLFSKENRIGCSKKQSNMKKGKNILRTISRPVGHSQNRDATDEMGNPFEGKPPSEGCRHWPWLSSFVSLCWPR